MEIINSLPSNQTVINFVHNLNDKIYVSNIALAQLINSWRHYEGLSPLIIIIIGESNGN